MNWYKLAKKGVSYSFSHVAVNFPKDIAKEIIDFGKTKIKDEDLYTEDKSMGRENEIHVTVKYGLHTTSLNKVQKVVENFGPIKIKLGEIDLFTTNDDYDVVIIKVDSKDLKKLNKEISDNLKCTDTYKVYKAHCTIAYVKKGTADKLKGNKKFNGKELTFDEVVFNSKDESSSKIKVV